MPYEVKKSDQCDASTPWGVFKKDGGELIACHATKEKAEAQIAAIGAHEHGDGKAAMTPAARSESKNEEIDDDDLDEEEDDLEAERDEDDLDDEDDDDDDEAPGAAKEDDDTEKGKKSGQQPKTRRPAAPAPLYRAFNVRVDRDELKTRAATGDDTLPIAISSEYPVERMDWWEGERYNEVLDHSPSSIDMSRAKDGLPFVLSHESSDARQQIGIVENVRVGNDRVLRGDVRFSSSPDAQQFKRDMIDGIRKSISVGYLPDMNNVERTQADEDAIPTERCMRWTPMEASLVPIPADPTVGVGRSATDDLQRLGERIAKDPKFAKRVKRALRAAAAGSAGTASTRAAHKAQEETVKTNGTAAEGGAATPTITVGEDKARAAERETQIRNLGKLFKLPEERVSEFVGAGMEARDVGALLVAEAQSKLRAMSATMEMSVTEARHYSLSRAIVSQINAHPKTLPNERVSVDAKFEEEVDQELRKNFAFGNFNDHGGLLVPTRIKVGGMIRTIDTQSSSGAKGGNLIFSQPGEYIDFLWPRMQVAKLGATRLSGLQGPVKFPKITATSSWTWTGDNPGSDVADSDPTFGQVSLDPKEGQSTTGYTRSALIQAASGNVDLEAKVQNQLFLTAALGIDKAAIQGPGTNAPTGVLNTSGIGSVAGGTNGAVPTRQNMSDLRVQVAAANADIGPGAFLSTPGIRGTLENVFASVSGTPAGLPVWNDDEVLGETALVSTQVPSTGTKGTSSGICHSIIYGIWSTLNIGYWGAYELVVDPYTKKKQGIIEVTNYQIVGVALEYAAAFAAMQDALIN